MWARCQVQHLPPVPEKSAELPAVEPHCQSCPPRPAPGQALSSASPSPASMSIWVPPWDQEEEAGRGQRFWNLAACQLCDLELAAAHSGPQFRHIT